MLIDTLTAKLTADASGFTPVMERAGQQMRGLQGHAENANHGMTTLRRGFEALAMQATGVSGPIGRISTGLLMLGPGSQAVLGVSAGIGVIAGVYKLLSSTSTELIEKNNKIHDSFVGAAQGANVAARAALDKAKTDLGLMEVEVRARERMAESARLIRSPTASVAEAEAIRARAALASQINLVNALEVAWLKAKQDIVDASKKTKEHAEITNELAHAYENFADKISDLRVALQLLRPSFVEQVQMVQQLNLAYTQMMARQGVIGQGAPQLTPTTTRPFPTLRGKPEFVSQESRTIGQEALEPADKEMEKHLKERGAEIGAAFITAIASGAKNMGDFLKQVMLEIANMAILKVFKVLLKIGSPSIEGIDIGKNFSLGLAMGVASGAPAVGGASGAVAARLAGSATFGLNLSGMPAARDPRQAARDQDWQSFLRESSLVAQTAGFKFS